MQQICQKTGGGVGPSPLQALNPEEMEAQEAAKLLEGGGNVLIRPSQQPFGVTTAKKHHKVGYFPFYYVKILFWQIFKQRRPNIIIRWLPVLLPTNWMLVTIPFWID